MLYPPRPEAGKPISTCVRGVCRLCLIILMGLAFEPASVYSVETRQDRLNQHQDQNMAMIWRQVATNISGL
jgi:hypothetical protein